MEGGILRKEVVFWNHSCFVKCLGIQKWPLIYVSYSLVGMPSLPEPVGRTMSSGFMVMCPYIRFTNMAHLARQSVLFIKGGVLFHGVLIREVPLCVLVVHVIQCHRHSDRVIGYRGQTIINSVGSLRMRVAHMCCSMTRCFAIADMLYYKSVCKEKHEIR